MSVCVCVCVCLSVRDHIFGTARPIYTIFSCMLAMAMALSSSDGFMDDVTFSQKARLLDVAAKLKSSTHAALGLAITCAQ